MEVCHALVDPLLHYVEADGRNYEEFKDREASLAALAECGTLPEENPWEARYTALYRHDHAKANQSLRETLLAINEEDRIIAIQCGDRFPGADLPILRHMAKASPEYRPREVAEFLGD